MYEQTETWDAVIIGSGPNGLSAAIRLAQQGANVLVLEARPTPGGGMRTAELTLPGFKHDICSSCHPLGVLSPFFRTLSLDKYGLEWIFPEVSVAHPLDNQPAVLLTQDLRETAARLGVDEAAYQSLLKPFLEHPHALFKDILGPLSLPSKPMLLSRYGMKGVQSAVGLANRSFSGPAAKALLAGCAAHATLPLESAFTAAMGLVFLIAGHTTAWPVARGGSAAITRALVAHFESLGGVIRCNTMVTDLRDLPPTRVVLFDTGPDQLATMGEAVFPARFTRALRTYRFGPGAFKVDWALREAIPWKDPQIARASTVHLGGTMEEIAAGERSMFIGGHPERPYVLLVQQSNLDPSRAPDGQHTGCAYVHVPAHSDVDMTDAIENQIERFAPGFRSTILARHTLSTSDLQRYNPNNVGGAVTGGVTDARQLFTRPTARLNPYTTPHPRLFLCSASTPPGGGVHGMCGYYGAEAAMPAIRRFPATPLA